MRGVAAAVALGAAACTGGSPAEPSPTPCATITIAGNAVSPRDVVVAPGCQVSFVNRDSRSHDMHSDPHPQHGDCPPIDDVGLLNPGQSRQTGNLTVPGTCGFHDHGLPGVDGLRGTITVR